MSRIEQSITLTNKMGLHARPSTQIATLSGKFSSEISISKDDLNIDAKSVLELLMLAAGNGEELTIIAEGDDAEEAVNAITKLISDGFGELEVDA